MDDQALYLRTMDSFVPRTEKAIELFEKCKVGDIVELKQIKKRNGPFFRKWWSLVKFAYDHWTPSELSGKRFDGVEPQKDMERFRKDLIILAGHYEQVIRLDGSLQIRAKSISWSNMTEEHFADFYKASFDVVWNKIFIGMYKDKDDLEKVLYELNGFG